MTGVVFFACPRRRSYINKCFWRCLANFAQRNDRFNSNLSVRKPPSQEEVHSDKRSLQVRGDVWELLGISTGDDRMPYCWTLGGEVCQRWLPLFCFFLVVRLNLRCFFDINMKALDFTKDLAIPVWVYPVILRPLCLAEKKQLFGG